MKMTLESLRKKHKATVEELSVFLDVSSATIRNWEKGRVQANNMSIKTFSKMTLYYDISMNDLFQIIQNSL